MGAKGSYVNTHRFQFSFFHKSNGFYRLKYLNKVACYEKHVFNNQELDIHFLLIMLLLLSQFFPLCPFHRATPTPSNNPHTIVHVPGHTCKFFGCSIPYSVPYIPMAIL